MAVAHVPTAHFKAHPPYPTRTITVRSAVPEVGYGYVMYASRKDWKEIADAIDSDYIRDTVADYPASAYGPQVGIHFDAAELADVWGAIARLDLESGKN